MWSPTHAQVTVIRAKNLLLKGKHDTNNCFVTISLGKEKYQTSTKEKALKNVEWHEECELSIPNQGNKAELVLTCLHHNNLGLDDFLGQISLPLCDMDVYERPRSKWYKLQSKPGKDKKKERGELEVRVAFTVKAGSLTDLNKKDKNKSSKSNVGGSLLSIAAIEKRKSLKKFAKSLGSKMHLNNKDKSKNDKNKDDDSFSGSYASIGSGLVVNPKISRQTFEDADPGVISENEDEFTFDNLSHKSSGSSLNIPASNLKSSSSAFLSSTQFSTLNEESLTNIESQKQPPPKPERAIKPEIDEWESKLYGGSSDSLKRRSWDTRTTVKPNIEINETIEDESIVSSSTAPTTPTPILKDKNDVLHYNDIPKVENNENHSKTLPRSLTLESINEREDKKIVESKNIFAKKLKYFRKDKSNENLLLAINGKQMTQMDERIIIGHENDIKKSSKSIEISQEVLKKYDGKSREEIIKIAHSLETEVRTEKMKIKELEDYLDNLLLRVMETHPRILQNPYSKMGLMKR